MHRTYSLNAFFRARFGRRVQKIPLDAGFDCPNRDGSISRAGCAFCNPSGSGSGLLDKGLDLRAQWSHWQERMQKRYGAALFAAYLQSYSNTYGPHEKLEDVLRQLKGLPGLAALSIGTRPDCLDERKLDLLAEQKEQLGLGEVFLELGLQSASNSTLEHINRGHTAEAFARAAEQAATRGLNVVAHVIAGLPTPEGREHGDDLLATVRFVNGLPVNGIKFHNLYVCAGTRMAALWKNGRYEPITLEEYCDWLGRALMILPPETVVHRLNGDPARGELLAPQWAGEKHTVLNAIRDHLQANDIWQGKDNGAPHGPPDHFTPPQENRHAS